MLCAGYKGAFAFDDAYCAGRIVQLIDGERGDGAMAAVLARRLTRTRSTASTPARTARRPRRGHRLVRAVDVLESVPRLARMVGPGAGKSSDRVGSPEQQEASS